MIARFAIYETDAALAAFEDDGAALLTEALPVESCVEARTKIDALKAQHWDEAHADPRGPSTSSGQAMAVGRFLDRYLCVFNRDAYWLQFLDRPGVIDIAE